jgi:hypothetical protein
MEDFDIEVHDCKNVYWASTDEYTLDVNGNEHTIRLAEDSNGAEMLYKHENGWMNIHDAVEDSEEIAAIVESWQDGELDLYCK